jgi:hypothetical protein
LIERARVEREENYSDIFNEYYHISRKSRMHPHLLREMRHLPSEAHLHLRDHALVSYERCASLTQDVASPTGEQLIFYERRNVSSNFWIFDTAVFNYFKSFE